MAISRSINAEVQRPAVELANGSSRRDAVPSSQSYSGAQSTAAIPPASSSASQGTVPAETPLPLGFNVVMNLYFFLMGANYTVVLPTVSQYTKSLGGGYWTAGLIVALFMGPSIVTSPLAPYLVRWKYMPLVVVAIVSQFVGSVLYGLGQVANSLALVLLARLIAGFTAMGPMLYLFIDATSQCAHRKFRTATVARRNNSAFFGMGMGPVIAAGLSHLHFSIGDLKVDEYTSPGWLFAVLWVLLLGALVLVPEPRRLFEHESDADAAGSPNPQTHRATLVSLAWCCFTIVATSAAISVWETSAAIVTQQTFGWPLLWSSLFIGALFLSSTIGGEIVRACRGRIKEADVVVASLAGVVLSSLFLFWYLPEHPSDLALIGGGEIPYVLGGVLVLNAANIGRTFATTLAQRAASAEGAKLRKRTTVAISMSQALGRTIGALIGLGAMTLKGGVNVVAAFICFCSFVALLSLLPPQPRGILRET